MKLKDFLEQHKAEKGFKFFANEWGNKEPNELISIGTKTAFVLSVESIECLVGLAKDLDWQPYVEKKKVVLYQWIVKVENRHSLTSHVEEDLSVYDSTVRRLDETRREIEV